ncbi:hypothetical protein AB4876_16750 [Zhongshania guokunii]|uniref:Uncharacterized protein n=1 Tax=Zhongshania guokunii TaxID=641783 RepID=A0ABV3UBM3_9GAMM
MLIYIIYVFVITLSLLHFNALCSVFSFVHQLFEVTVMVSDTKKFVLLDGGYSTLENGALPVIKTLDWLSRKDIFDEHQRQRFLP